MNAISLFVASLLSLNASQNLACRNDCATSDAGVNLVSHFEGFSPFVYKDVAGYDTIGTGHLIIKGEKFKEPLLPDEADNLLRSDLKKTEKSINRRVKVSLKQNQADALISFTFNLGEGSLARSTLLKRVNAERHKDVPPQFLPWDKAWDPKVGARVPVKGLQVRRKIEAAMYAGN